MSRKQKCGAGQPPAPHSSVDLLTCLIRHSRGGMMLLARQRSRGNAAFAKAGCTRDLAITKRNRCGGRQPIPTHERDRGGGRNARATSSRSHAFLICPPAIHPRESPAAAGPAAIIRQAQKTLTFSLHPTVSQNPAPRNKKTAPACAKTVDEKPSLWKPEENRGWMLRDCLTRPGIFRTSL